MTVFKTLPVDVIHANDYNPNHMTTAEFAELVLEVRHLGRIPKPVIVRPNDDGYVVVDGEHGWRAAREAEISEVPCEIVEIDDFEARRQTFKRNQHGTHDQVALGCMFREMMDERDLSQRALAKEIEVSEGTVRNALLYAHAADVRNSYAPKLDGDITSRPIRQVRAYVSLPPPIGDYWLNAGGDFAKLDPDVFDPIHVKSNIDLEPSDWRLLIDLGIHLAFEEYSFAYAPRLWEIWSFYEKHQKRIPNLKAYLLPAAMSGFGAAILDHLPLTDNPDGLAVSVPPEKWAAILDDAGSRLKGSSLGEYMSIVGAAIRLIMKPGGDNRDYSDPRVAEAVEEINSAPDYIRDADFTLEERLTLHRASAEVSPDMLDAAKREAVKTLSERDRVLKDLGNTPHPVLSELATITPIGAVNSALQRLQIHDSHEKRNELFEDRERLTVALIEAMTRIHVFRTEKIGKAPVAEVFRKRMDNMPWPELRFLAAHVLGEQMPAIMFWLEAARADMTGFGCVKGDAA